MPTLGGLRVWLSLERKERYCGDDVDMSSPSEACTRRGTGGVRMIMHSRFFFDFVLLAPIFFIRFLFAL